MIFLFLYLSIQIPVYLIKKMNKLINFSEATSIAIHSLAYIAFAGRLVNASELAEKTFFSKNHISKVLQTLTRHNLLHSERGPNGGFSLKKDPGTISLMDIYSLIEGKPDEIFCGIHKDRCNFSACVYGDMMDKFAADIYNYLQNRTIKSFM